MGNTKSAASSKWASPSLSYERLLDLSALVSLVYEYSKDPDFRLEPNEPLSKFLHETPESELDFHKEQRLLAIAHLERTSPNGMVARFINGLRSSLEAGITIDRVKQTITVVFRGTESTTDWFADALFLKKNLPTQYGLGISVHSGFYYHLESEAAYEMILDAIKGLLASNPGFEVHACGHSLGAAVATLFGFLAAKDLMDDYPSQHIKVGAFASPRVGNEAFYDACLAQPNLCIDRISNESDIVTGVPSIGFHHVGCAIKLRGGRAEVLGDAYPISEFAMYSNYSVAAHDDCLYFANLRKAGEAGAPW